MSKIQIWKRITTCFFLAVKYMRLYLICQRYKFESESQLYWYNPNSLLAVFNMSKIQIWKRITTWYPLAIWLTWLYLICQRYKFESESQRRYINYITKFAVFNMSKIQIWKRITTRFWPILFYGTLYLICQRYKFESESQRFSQGLLDLRAVFNMSKIQIWKRITTLLGLYFGFFSCI